MRDKERGRYYIEAKEEGREREGKREGKREGGRMLKEGSTKENEQ